MWKSRKFVIIAVLAALVLAGSIGGVALAAQGATDNTTPVKTVYARVAAILGIDQQKLESAFTQARTEMRDEALDKWLQNAVAQGRMTQAQADQYKTWAKSRPEIPGFGPGGHTGGFGGPRGGMMGPRGIPPAK